MVVVHLVLGAMTYVDFDAYHKYNDFAGIQGYVLMFLRICLFAYYVYCFTSNKDSIPRRSIEFYRPFFVLGCAYFMIVPFSIIAQNFFEPYNRQYFYTFMTNIAQMITACILL